MEKITLATRKAMGLQLTNMIQPYKAGALGQAKKAVVSKIVVSHSSVSSKKLFIDIISPSTASMCGKKHWLLVVEDSIMPGTIF